MKDGGLLFDYSGDINTGRFVGSCNVSCSNFFITRSILERGGGVSSSKDQNFSFRLLSCNKLSSSDVDSTEPDQEDPENSKVSIMSVECFQNRGSRPTSTYGTGRIDRKS